MSGLEVALRETDEFGFQNGQFRAALLPFAGPFGFRGLTASDQRHAPVGALRANHWLRRRPGLSSWSTLVPGSKGASGVAFSN
jgi:hypothetical protein